MYGTQILSIIVLYSAKLSLILVLARLSLSVRMLWLSRTVSIFVTAWSFAAILALAFQCKVPDPWTVTAGRCLNRVSTTRLMRK